MRAENSDRHGRHVDIISQAPFPVYGLDLESTVKQVVKLEEDSSPDGIRTLVGVSIRHELTASPGGRVIVRSAPLRPDDDAVSRARRALAAKLWEPAFEDSMVWALSEDVRRTRWDQALEDVEHVAAAAELQKIRIPIAGQQVEFDLVTSGDVWAAAGVAADVAITMIGDGTPNSISRLMPVTDPDAFLTS
jgi:hypothetical protein